MENEEICAASGSIEKRVISARKGKRHASSLISATSKKLKSLASDSANKDLRYIVDPRNHFPSKVGFNYMVNAVQMLKTYLNEKQLQMFRETCFGYFLDMNNVVSQPQLVHSLVLREVECDLDDEMWFKVGGVKLRFGIEEFALVSGLKCYGDRSKAADLNWKGELKTKYFPNSKTVHKLLLLDFFKAKLWDSDNDALKISVLFFIHWFVMNTRRERCLTQLDFDIVDSGLYNEYPWGRDAFNALIYSMKGRLRERGTDKRRSRSNQSFTYRMDGFPVAFQIWFYECCSRADGICASKIGDRIPRVLNWRASDQPTLKTLKNKIFEQPKLEVKNLFPSGEEVKQLNLNLLCENLKEKFSAAAVDSENIDDAVYFIDWKHGNGCNKSDELSSVSARLSSLVNDYKEFQNFVTEEFRNQHDLNARTFDKVFKALDEIRLKVGLPKCDEPFSTRETHPYGAVDHMDKGQVREDVGDMVNESVIKEDEAAAPDHMDEGQLREDAGDVVNGSVIKEDKAAKNEGSAKLDTEGCHEVLCRDIVPYVDFIFKDLISLVRRG